MLNMADPADYTKAVMILTTPSGSASKISSPIAAL